MKPYYEHGGITIYHGDCREMLPQLSEIECVLADPPYGIGYESHHNSSRTGEWAKWVRDENFESIVGDDEPFRPEHLFGFPKIAMFGANYYASRLPDSRCWITWDKRGDMGRNDFADCELIWTNLDRPSRVFTHLWSGLIRAGRENVSREDKLHPHQKPVALCKFILTYAEVAGAVCEPYCGSGSALVAAKEMNLPAIGIEIEEKYCEIAAKRLSQEVFDFSEVK